MPFTNRFDTLKYYSCSSLNLPAWSKALCVLKTTVFGVLKSQSNWNKEMFLYSLCVIVQASVLLYPSAFQRASASYWRDTDTGTQIISIFSFLSVSCVKLACLFAQRSLRGNLQKDEMKGQKVVVFLKISHQSSCSAPFLDPDRAITILFSMLWFFPRGTCGTQGKTTCRVEVLMRLWPKSVCQWCPPCFLHLNPSFREHSLGLLLLIPVLAFLGDHEPCH